MIGWLADWLIDELLLTTGRCIEETKALKVCDLSLSIAPVPLTQLGLITARSSMV